MIDRRRGLRDLALAGLMGLTLTASLVPTVAVAATGTASDLPEWAQDDGDHPEGPWASRRRFQARMTCATMGS